MTKENDMKTLRRFLGCVLLSSAILSCQTIAQPVEDGGMLNDDSAVVVELDLSCESLETEEDATVRSLHGASSLRKITNANYYLFHDGVLAGQRYFEDASDFAVSLPSYVAEYSLYVLANVGEVRLKDGVREEDMDEAVHYDYATCENYFTVMESYGFPMSLIVNGFSALWKDGLMLRRLVHTLYVTADTDALNSTEMRFTGVSVRNAARDFFPFAEKSKAQYVMDGDAANLDEGDIEALNNGERVTLYLLENMRGDLFPGNKDWKNKVPVEMEADAEEKGKCSYIELTASAQTATAYYEHNIYRAYIGSGAEDCDVRRHAYSVLNNRFVNEMIVDEEWRVESDDPVITGRLAFVRTDGGMEDIGSTSLLPGFKRDFYIYRSNPDIRYSLAGPDASEPPYISFTAVQVDDHYTKVTVKTAAEWGESYPETGHAVFEINSEDGLISDRLYCSLITEPVEVTFSYGPDAGTSVFRPSVKPNLLMSVDNSLGLGFDVKINGTCGAYIFYYPNGTWGKKVEETFEHSFRTGTLSRIYPRSGQAEILDEYLDCTTVINVPGYGLYDFFMKDIWYFTREDSYNKIGSSHSYNKHFQPVKLKMDIEMKFAASEDGTLYPESTASVLPVRVTNDDRVIISEYIMGFKAGTDFGIFWNQMDNADSGALRRIEFKEMYTSESEGAIRVSVNGTREWNSGIKLTM